MFKVNILTIFPDMFPGPLAQSLSGLALKKGIWSIKTINIRDFSTDKHGSVDDRPYGGGSGMVLKPEVVGRAIESVLLEEPETKIFYMSPSGKKFNQDITRQVTKFSNITILCGRFEGVDARVIEYYKIEELSIGDYILSGGELAAMVFIDSCLRLIDGVVKNKSSILNDSFGDDGILECPPFTRPQNWNGLSVPGVLLSGNHAEIESWKREKSLAVTKLKRPDLLLNDNLEFK